MSTQSCTSAARNAQSIRPTRSSVTHAVLRTIGFALMVPVLLPLAPVWAICWGAKFLERFQEETAPTPIAQRTHNESAGMGNEEWSYGKRMAPRRCAPAMPTATLCVG